MSDLLAHMRTIFAYKSDLFIKNKIVFVSITITLHLTVITIINLLHVVRKTINVLICIYFEYINLVPNGIDGNLEHICFNGKNRKKEFSCFINKYTARLFQCNFLIVLPFSKDLILKQTYAVQ